MQCIYMICQATLSYTYGWSSNPIWSYMQMPRRLRFYSEAEAGMKSATFVYQPQKDAVTYVHHRLSNLLKWISCFFQVLQGLGCGTQSEARCCPWVLRWYESCCATASFFDTAWIVSHKWHHQLYQSFLVPALQECEEVLYQEPGWWELSAEAKNPEAQKEQQGREWW